MATGNTRKPCPLFAHSSARRRSKPPKRSGRFPLRHWQSKNSHPPWAAGRCSETPWAWPAPRGNCRWSLSSCAAWLGLRCQMPSPVSPCRPTPTLRWWLSTPAEVPTRCRLTRASGWRCGWSGSRWRSKNCLIFPHHLPISSGNLWAVPPLPISACGPCREISACFWMTMTCCDLPTYKTWCRPCTRSGRLSLHTGG